MFRSRVQIHLNVRKASEVDLQAGRKFGGAKRQRQRAYRLLEAAGFNARSDRFLVVIRTDDEAELHAVAALLRRSYRRVDIGYWGDQPVADELVWPPRVIVAQTFARHGLGAIVWPETALETIAA